MKKTLVIVITAILALALLAGCASSKSNDSAGWGGDGRTEDSVTAPGAPQEAPSVDYEKGLTGGEVTDAAGQNSVDEMYGGRKVIRTYNLSLLADDFDAALAAVEQRLADFAGYSLNTSITGQKPKVYGDSGRTASLTLRVPAEKAKEFVAGVQALGTVSNYQDYSDDITDAYFDTDSRLEVLRTELGRLQSILVQTDNLADVIALEDRIGEVMLEIEQLTGTLKKYDALVDYSTVNITLNEKSLTEGPAATQTAGERIKEGFTDSLYGVGTFFTNLFVWFVSSLPVLAVLAAIAVGVIFIVRASTKRSAKKHAEAAAKAAVRQQALFEKEKAAYIAQQKAEEEKNEENKSKEEV